MKHKWDCEKNRGILNTYRNVNNDVVLLSDFTSSSSFEHIFVRFLNSLSAHITFLVYYIEIDDMPNIEKSFNYIQKSANEINKIEQILEKEFYNENLDNLICLCHKLKNYNIDNINPRNLNFLKGYIKNFLNDMKSDKSYPSAFQNDYYKISSCSSFRRLQDKAQVYPLEIEDYSRTRLTHTLEVCGTSRMISSIIDNSLEKTKHIRIKDILECGCLIHDIGNPPFGHYGESIIRNYFIDNWDKLKINNEDVCLENIISKQDQLYYDFAYFDGNAQSLRVMSQLQFYKENSNLEVSLSVLGSIIKYPFNSITANENKKTKLGYFYSEQNSIIKRLEATGTYIENYRNPISILLEASDDISYVISDIDDGIKKGIITKDIFEFELNRINKNDKQLLDFADKYNKYIEINKSKNINNPFAYTIKYLLIDLKDSLIKETAKCFINKFDYIVNDGIEFSFEKNNKNEILSFDEISSGKILSWLKDALINKYIFNNKDVLISELKGGQILYQLLDQFTKAILLLDIGEKSTSESINEKNKKYQKELKLFNIISKNFVDVFLNNYNNSKTEKEKIYYKLKLVVDYLCGMTDTYITNLYNKLFLGK